MFNNESSIIDQEISGDVMTKLINELTSSATLFGSNEKNDELSILLENVLSIKNSIDLDEQETSELLRFVISKYVNKQVEKFIDLMPKNFGNFSKDYISINVSRIKNEWR